MQFKPGDRIIISLDLFKGCRGTGTVMDRKNLDPLPAKPITADNERLLVVLLDDWDNSMWIHSPYFLVWAKYCGLMQ